MTSGKKNVYSFLRVSDFLFVSCFYSLEAAF